MHTSQHVLRLLCPGCLGRCMCVCPRNLGSVCVGMCICPRCLYFSSPPSRPPDISNFSLALQQAIWTRKALTKWLLTGTDQSSPEEKGWRALSAHSMSLGHGSPATDSSGPMSQIPLPTTQAALALSPFPSASSTSPPLPLVAHTRVQGSARKRCTSV